MEMVTRHDSIPRSAQAIQNNNKRFKSVELSIAKTRISHKQ